MGSSIIWHGDSRVLAPYVEGPINAIITDPPYGMGHVSSFVETAAGKRWARKIENDSDPDAACVVFLDAVLPLVERCADDAEMYVFTRWSLVSRWEAVLAELAPFEYKNMLIWDKETPGMGDLKGNWAYSFEVILYAKKGRHELPERRSSIIRCNRTPNHQMIHPTQKPVELMETLIRMSTSPGDLIVDPFSGSGSTALAAQRLGRRCIGIELDQEYYQRSSLRLNEGAFSFE